MEAQTIKTASSLLTSDNPIIAILAFGIVILSGVVVYQWKYTMGKTVPKWIWDSLVIKIDKILDTQDRLGTIIDERLKK